MVLPRIAVGTEWVMPGVTEKCSGYGLVMTGVTQDYSGY